MSLSAFKIDAMIQDLADLRVSLLPRIPDAMTNGAKVFATPNPRWAVSAEVDEDGRTLLIRHPGFGWLAFVIPFEECDRLAAEINGTD